LLKREWPISGSNQRGERPISGSNQLEEGRTLVSPQHGRPDPQRMDMVELDFVYSKKTENVGGSIQRYFVGLFPSPGKDTCFVDYFNKLE
jgi:hypothetical protein